MNEIAQIGFVADTSDLAVAEQRLDALPPKAEKAARASDRFNQSMSNMNAASAKLMAAADRLTMASDRLASASNREATAVDNAANANSRKAKVVSTAAAADIKAAQASDEAAAAAKREAAAAGAAAAAKEKETKATDQLTAARRRGAAVPIVPRDKEFVSPWSRPSSTGSGPGRSGRVPLMPREQEWVGPWGRSQDTPPFPANDNRRGSQQFNTANIAAQFQDIGVTAAMGMNPLQIALQQGTQISAVLSTMEKPLKGIAAAFTAIISPVSLLTIGLVALVAVGLQLVNWTKIAQGTLRFIADILPEVAAGATLAGAALALAFAPSIAAGIWAITTAIASGLLVAIGGIVAAVGAIPLAIALILADLIIFRKAWEQTLGVDLVGIAKSVVNFIIGAFVGAYHDIEFLWKNFPDVIGAAVTGAANAGIRVLNKWIEDTQNKLNLLIAGVNAISGFFGKGELIDPLNLGQIDEYANDAATRLEKAVKERNKQLQEDLQKDYIGTFWDAITGSATDLAAMVRRWADELGITDTKSRKGKSEMDHFRDITEGAERSIASMEAERKAIGLTAEAAAKLKYETQLLNEAQEKGISLTPKQRDRLLELAAAMAKADAALRTAKGIDDINKNVASRVAELNMEREAIGMNEKAVATLRLQTELLNDAREKGIELTPKQTEQLLASAKAMAEFEVATKEAKEAFEFAQGETKTFVDDFIQGIKNGESAWKSFGDAALSVLERIGKKLVDLAIDDLFTGGNKSGGFLSDLLGLFTGSTQEKLKVNPIAQTASAAASVNPAILAGSVGSYTSAMKAGGGYGSDLVSNAKQLAANIGANPRDVLALMSFESGLNPGAWGGTNRNHYGLIQAGGPERAQYGIQPGGSLASQFTGIEAYFKDRGFKPGMSGLDLYSTVNAGRPGLYNASDAANGGTWGNVRDKWTQQMDAHFEKADKLLGTFNDKVGATIEPLTNVAGASKVAGESVGTFAKDLTSFFPAAPSAPTGGGGGWLSSLFGGGGNLFTGLFANFNPLSAMTGLFAKGGAFANGISGFSNGIVSQPTLFKFASGAGLMGEAGPEAVMPLTRGPDGSLGVQMYNAPSSNSNSTVNYNTLEIAQTFVAEGVTSEKTMTDRMVAQAAETERTIRDKVVPWLQQFQTDGQMGNN